MNFYNFIKEILNVTKIRQFEYLFISTISTIEFFVEIHWKKGVKNKERKGRAVIERIWKR